MQPASDSGGFEVARGVVAQELVDDALRLLHIDLLEHGHSARALSEWLWAMHWFPHLNRRDEILALAQALPARWRSGMLCDPQILLQFPHVGAEPEIVFHLDEEPPWAGGRRYVRIVGVPLSPWRQDNGGLLVQVDGEAVAVELDPTDAVMLPPNLLHSGGEPDRLAALRRLLPLAAGRVAAAATTAAPARPTAPYRPRRRGCAARNRPAPGA
jgi:hypothetical protein